MAAPADGNDPSARGDGPSLRRGPWQDRRVLLGVTGGIAAYKAVHVARELTLRGAHVEVVLSHSASAFVGPVTFEGVTGRPVHTELVAAGRALDHIRLARWAEVVCIAPATADFIARAAQGRADDLLTAILLATNAPVLVCPAMNDAMWAHPQTQRNAAHLSAELAYQLVGPAVGPLAWGEGVGPGRMEEPETIVECVARALAAGNSLDGRVVVVTAGPTREPVDAVRVLTNRSSGKMGFAVAAGAWRRGARVVLIHGPTDVAPPAGPELVRADTAEEMASAVRNALATADVLVMAAAVADFRPTSPSLSKIRKESRPDTIALEPAPDVLRTTREARPDGCIIVGFALETDDALASARRKLIDKGLDMIVLNEVNAPDAGFEVDTNRVVLIDAHGREESLPLLPKSQVAEILLDRIADLIATRA